MLKILVAFVLCTNLLTNLLTSTLFAQTIDPEKKAISYKSRGRLGNCLINYLYSKWIAKKYRLPFLYEPFLMSDQFLFHSDEKALKCDWEAKFHQITDINHLSSITALPDSTLILTNFFHISPKLKPNSKWNPRMFWADPEFRAFAAHLMQPAYPIQTLDLPKDKMTVVAHVRTGGGYDKRSVQLKYPAKFPPLKFYTRAVELIRQHYPDKPLYLFIMTDDKQPEQLAKYFESELSHLHSIEIDYRKGKSGPSNNVLEDFFSIQKFDCVVRGNSTFTTAATILGDYKMIVRASKVHAEDKEVVVDSVEVLKKGSSATHVLVRDS